MNSYIYPRCSVYGIWIPTFTTNKWPSFVGKYSSTMEQMGIRLDRNARKKTVTSYCLLGWRRKDIWLTTAQMILKKSQWLNDKMLYRNKHGKMDEHLSNQCKRFAKQMNAIIASPSKPVFFSGVRGKTQFWLVKPGFALFLLQIVGGCCSRRSTRYVEVVGRYVRLFRRDCPISTVWPFRASMFFL